MPRPTSIRVGVIQPHLERGALDAASTMELVEPLIRQAGRAGVQLVVLPEGCPGPMRIGDDLDLEGAVAQVARDARCGVCWSRVELERPGRAVLAVHLTGADGRRAGRYARTHPATGDVHATLSGTGIFPGREWLRAEVAGVPVGVLVCSELWLPEPARVLALLGAQVLLAPAGGGFHEVRDTWRLMARARAVENQCFVALTQSRFGDERGSALIAGPEGILAESETDGLIHAELDLRRMEWLRRHDDSMQVPKPFRALPGLLRARRPELYGPLTEPQPDAFDYEHPVEVSDWEVAR